MESNGEMLLVNSNGTVMWVPPVIYRSTCPVDMSNFPFDTQVSVMSVSYEHPVCVLFTHCSQHV